MSADMIAPFRVVNFYIKKQQNYPWVTGLLWRDKNSKGVSTLKRLFEFFRK